MDNPRVLVGAPTTEAYAYCLKEYAERVKELNYANYDVLLVDNSPTDNYLQQIKKAGLRAIKGPYTNDVRSRVITSRNLLRDYTLKHNYDYLLSLEQDVIPPKNIIERLLQHKKKVISGVYYKPLTFTLTKDNKVIKKEKRILPLLTKKKIKELPAFSIAHLHSAEDVEKERLLPIRAAGLGCMLIHKDILQQFPFHSEGKDFDDLGFSNDLYKNKIQLYADTSVKCIHLLKGKEKYL